MLSFQARLPASTRNWRDYRELLQLSIPILFGNVAVLAANAVDIVMMGHSSPAGLAGVATAGAIITVFFGLASSATISHQVLAAKGFGARSERDVASSFWHSLLFGGAIIALSGLFLLTVGPRVIQLIGRSPDVVAAAQAYLYARLPSLLLIVPAMLFRITLTADKQPRYAMYTSLITAAVDIALDYPLIFGFGALPALGAAGNGLASALADLCGFVFLTWAVSRRYGLPRLRLPPTHRRELSTASRLGLPMMISTTFDDLAIAVMFMIVGRLGMSYLAGAKIAYTFVTVLFGIMASFAMASQVLVGRAWGARDFDGMIGLAKRNFRLMMAILCTLAAPLFFWPELIAGVFTPFRTVQLVTAAGLRALAVSVPLMVLAYSGVVVLRALGWIKWDMYANLASVWLVQLPVAWLLAVTLDWKLTGICVSFIAYWLSRSLLTNVKLPVAIAIEFPERAV